MPENKNQGVRVSALRWIPVKCAGHNFLSHCCCSSPLLGLSCPLSHKAPLQSRSAGSLQCADLSERSIGGAATEAAILDHHLVSFARTVLPCLCLSLSVSGISWRVYPVSTLRLLGIIPVVVSKMRRKERDRQRDKKK